MYPVSKASSHAWRPRVRLLSQDNVKLCVRIVFDVSVSDGGASVLYYSHAWVLFVDFYCRFLTEYRSECCGELDDTYHTERDAPISLRDVTFTP